MTKIYRKVRVNTQKSVKPCVSKPEVREFVGETYVEKGQK